MATQTQQLIRPEQDQTIEKMFQEVRQLYTDAPQLANSTWER